MSYATMHTRINKLFVDLIWLGNRFLDKYKPQINMRTLYMAWMTLIKKHINAEDNPGNQLALALWVLWRIHRWLSEQKRCLASVKSNLKKLDLTNIYLVLQKLSYFELIIKLTHKCNIRLKRIITPRHTLELRVCCSYVCVVYDNELFCKNRIGSETLCTFSEWIG